MYLILKSFSTFRFGWMPSKRFLHRDGQEEAVLGRWWGIYLLYATLRIVLHLILLGHIRAR